MARGSIALPSARYGSRFPGRPGTVKVMLVVRVTAAPAAEITVAVRSSADAWIAAASTPRPLCGHGVNLRFQGGQSFVALHDSGVRAP